MYNIRCISEVSVYIMTISSILLRFCVYNNSIAQPILHILTVLASSLRQQQSKIAVKVRRQITFQRSVRLCHMHQLQDPAGAETSVNATAILQPRSIASSHLQR